MPGLWHMAEQITSVKTFSLTVHKACHEQLTIDQKHSFAAPVGRKAGPNLARHIKEGLSFKELGVAAKNSTLSLQSYHAEFALLSMVWRPSVGLIQPTQVPKHRTCLLLIQWGGCAPKKYTADGSRKGLVQNPTTRPE